MLNFEWYRTFKAIYQAGTLTGAAQELLISQPNVSQHLSALEAYIGKQLFERKPRKMVPTAYGKLFYTQIIASVEKLEHVETDFRHISMQKEYVMTCLGAPREFFESQMATRLCKMDVNLHVEFGISKELLKKCVKGDLMFVISTQKPDDVPLTFEPCFEECFHLVGSPGLHAAPFKKLVAQKKWEEAEAWLCEQQWFSYNSELMIIRRFWLNNFGKRPPVKPRFIIPDYASILRAVSAGKGLTVVSDYLAKELIKTRQLQDLWPGNATMKNTFYLAYDKQHADEAQVDMVRRLLRMKV